MKNNLLLAIVFLSSLFLTWCNTTTENNELFFSWSLRDDYGLTYTIKWIPQWSWWEYTVNINPIDEWYRRDKQPQTVTFSSAIKIEELIESIDDELYPDATTLTVPDLWLKITWDTIEIDNNFWIMCSDRDWDEFIMIPWWEWNISDETAEWDPTQYIWESYNFMGPVKYINHYRRWDIAMYYKRGMWDWFTIDDADAFSKNCMIEVWEIEDFLPLNLPFKLEFNNFDYTTIWFIKELSEDSNCLSSHNTFSPHNNYMSFYTEDMACQLWYESWTTLESVAFENQNSNQQ